MALILELGSDLVTLQLACFPIVVLASTNERLILSLGVTLALLRIIAKSHKLVDLLLSPPLAHVAKCAKLTDAPVVCSLGLLLDLLLTNGALRDAQVEPILRRKAQGLSTACIQERCHCSKDKFHVRI